MDQPPETGPSYSPPPAGQPGHTPGGASQYGGGAFPPSPVAPPPRSKLPWIIGGCGCLFLLLLVVAAIALFAFTRYGKSGRQAGPGRPNQPQQSESARFDPYQGSVAALLPPSLSTGAITFSLQTKDDRMDYWKSYGATDATGFTYNQTGAGVTVPLYGALVNFPSAADAAAALARAAQEQGATVEPKGRGQRFSGQQGQVVGWTNGSLLCYLKSEFERPALNFEQAAPF